MIAKLCAIAEEAAEMGPPRTPESPAAQQKVGELAQLLELIGRERPRHLLEIGCYYGGTAWAIHKAFPRIHLICVDNNSLDSGVDTAARLKTLGVPASFVFGDSTSAETLEKVRQITDSVDFVFIDGSHWYKDVRRDWELYSSITRPGGIVVLADIAEHEASTSCGGNGAMDVNQLWDEVAPHHEHFVIASAPSSWGEFGVIRMPQ